VRGWRHGISSQSRLCGADFGDGNASACAGYYWLPNYIHRSPPPPAHVPPKVTPKFGFGVQNAKQKKCCCLLSTRLISDVPSGISLDASLSRLCADAGHSGHQALDRPAVPGAKFRRRNVSAAIFTLSTPCIKEAHLPSPFHTSSPCYFCPKIPQLSNIVYVTLCSSCNRYRRNVRQSDCVSGSARCL
jgi:hypothetical protein